MPKQKITLDFECHQDWNAMSPCDTGRFCGVCKKTVIDFTGYSKSKFEKVKLENNGELCGRFAPHQLDDALYPIENLMPRKRMALASMFVFLGFSSLKAQSPVQDSIQIEQTDSSKSHCMQNEDLKEVDKDEKELNKIRKKRERRRKLINSSVNYMNVGSYSYYISWRFPFFVKTRHLMGRFVR